MQSLPLPTQLRAVIEIKLPYALCKVGSCMIPSGIGTRSSTACRLVIMGQTHHELRRSGCSRFCLAVIMSRFKFKVRSETRHASRSTISHFRSAFSHQKISTFLRHLFHLDISTPLQASRRLLVYAFLFLPPSPPLPACYLVTTFSRAQSLPGIE